MGLLAAHFQDHMVLQRGGAGAIVWGFVPPGTPVTASFAGSQYTASGDASGVWRVQLSPLGAGGPYTLTVTTASASVMVVDVLMGDVYM